MGFSLTDSNSPSNLPKNGQTPLIINVDDLGLSPSINEAVVKLGEKKRITATSFMVGGAIDQSTLQALDELKIDLGLHLDFTGIFPSYLKSGLAWVILANYLKRWQPDQVADIIHQQLDIFEQKCQRVPVFIDGHQHVHQLPMIRQALISVILKRYPNTKPCLRTTAPLIKDFKAQIIYLLGGLALQNDCQTHHIAHNGKFAGVYDFNANADRLKTLWQNWLKTAQNHTQNFNHDQKNDLPTLIMCHPATPNHHWQDEIKNAREHEFAWLMSDQFADLLAQYQVKLTRWQAI